MLTSPINLWLGIAALLNMVLAVFIYSQGQKTRANIFYSFTVLSASFWTFCMLMFRLVSGDFLYLWSVLLWVSTVPIVYFFLYFALNFPEEKEIKPFFHILLFIPAFLVLAVSIFYLGLFKQISFFNGAKGFFFNLPNFYFYSAYISGYFLASFVILFRKFKKAEGIIKRQLLFIIIGNLISSLSGVIFGLLLPLLGHFYFYWLSPGLIIAVTGFIAYAIFKHHLMDVKVITTEVFSALISIMALIDALISKTKVEFAAKFGLFLGVVFFSSLLIRSILKEVKTREQLATLSQDLQKANEDLKKLDKAKSEFISIASHQLRTPLSIIKGYASMLLEGSYGVLPEKAKDIIGKMTASNERLIRLINDLLDISRMEGGRMKFDWNFIVLSELVQSVVEELRPQADKKGLALNWRTLGEKTYVRADEEKLRQVIMNLIDNAIKYTPKGQVDVSIEKVDNGSKIRFMVKDTGIGMQKEEMEVLFGKFIRGRDVPKVWTEGVGLGLYVAKMIMQEHQGKIWAESDGENKGSAFNIELPVY